MSDHSSDNPSRYSFQRDVTSHVHGFLGRPLRELECESEEDLKEHPQVLGTALREEESELEGTAEEEWEQQTLNKSSKKPEKRKSKRAKEDKPHKKAKTQKAEMFKKEGKKKTDDTPAKRASGKLAPAELAPLKMKPQKSKVKSNIPQKSRGTHALIWYSLFLCFQFAGKERVPRLSLPSEVCRSHFCTTFPVSFCTCLQQSNRSNGHAPGFVLSHIQTDKMVTLSDNEPQGTDTRSL